MIEERAIELVATSSAVVRASAIALMLLAVAATIPLCSSGIFPKLVMGYVWDNADTPLEDAEVAVNLGRPGTSVWATSTD